MAPDTKQTLFGGESDEEDISVSAFKVNQEYARRFEHNKKREELHRLEEKYKNGNAEDDEDDESSDSETEDEDAFLATEQVDAEINAVLNAIKNKDPRLKDKHYNWYKSLDEAETVAAPKPKEQKPVTLRDYHRMNLLKTEEAKEDTPKTYVQEQEEIKKSIAEEVARHEEESDDGEEFFHVKKQPSKASVAETGGVHPSRAAKIVKQDELPDPDQDPEGFLMKYASSRAWAAKEKGPNWQAFDSDDDDEEDERMEQIEHAFNMRFEDPEKSNEIISTFARADRSVRRDKPTARKSKREQENERKALEKKERQEERARLRRLKIEENEEKLRKVKEAAGLSGKTIADEDLMKLLEDAWDDDKWEEVMKKRFFNDTYYTEQDAGMAEEDEEAGEQKKKSKKPKKPKWDDDIDIKDLIPDFEEEEKPAFSLSDEEDGDEEGGGAPLNAGPDGKDVDQEQGKAIEYDEDDEETAEGQKLKNSRARKRERQEAKSKARRERARVEALVDAKMELDDPAVLIKSKSSSGGSGMAFRYRETSPNTFGLTARDILLAPSDVVLNDFAGLKKHATWRDEEKKRRDRKKLGKKARLRQWRKEVYGEQFAQTGPTFGFERLAAAADQDGDGEGYVGFEEKNKWENNRDKKDKKRKLEADDKVREKQGEQKGRKKRRQRKGKTAETAAADAA